MAASGSGSKTLIHTKARWEDNMPSNHSSTMAWDSNENSAHGQMKSFLWITLSSERHITTKLYAKPMSLHLNPSILMPYSRHCPRTHPWTLLLGHDALHSSNEYHPRNYWLLSPSHRLQLLTYPSHPIFFLQNKKGHLLDECGELLGEGGKHLLRGLVVGIVCDLKVG